MLPVSLLLVFDHLIFREALRALLNREPDLQVVAEAGDRAETQKMAAALRPALAIVDMLLPHGLALAAVRDICMVSPETGVLVLSESLRNEDIAGAFAAGAKGYALKEQRGSDIVTALRAIRKGQRYLAPGLAAPKLGARGSADAARLAARDRLLNG